MVVEKQPIPQHLRYQLIGIQKHTMESVSQQLKKVLNEISECDFGLDEAIETNVVNFFRVAHERRIFERGEDHNGRIGAYSQAYSRLRQKKGIEYVRKIYSLRGEEGVSNDTLKGGLTVQNDDGVVGYGWTDRGHYSGFEFADLAEILEAQENADIFGPNTKEEKDIDRNLEITASIIIDKCLSQI